jgi:predicted nucleic acid-binding protein
MARQTRKFVIWWATPVELSSAFSQLLKSGKLNEEELKHALTRKAMLRHSWLEVQPSEHLRDLAESLPERYQLRAADALQLAAALIWCKEKPRHRPFASFDEQLAHTAAKAGFTVIS